MNKGYGNAEKESKCPNNQKRSQPLIGGKGKTELDIIIQPSEQ